MYCKYCGTENADTSKFCKECGKLLRTEAPKPEAAGEALAPDQTAKEAAQVRPGQEGVQPNLCNQNPYGQNVGGQGGPQSNPYQQNSIGQNGAQVNSPNQNPYNQNSYNQNSYNQNSYNQNPYNQNSYNQNPYNQNPYNQKPYGQANAASDGHGMGVPKKKKSKKPLVITLVIAVLVAVIGSFVFLGIRAGSTSAPIKQFERSMKSGDWGKLYSSIYWGEDMDNYQTKSEFIDSMDESVSSLVAMVSTFSGMKFEIQDEGLSYTGSDGLTRKDVTVTMKVSIFGTDQEENLDLTLVKAGKKFGMFPTWKIDASSMGEFF
ncbi:MULTISPECIES: zinc-ribbon domain-containing protein [unclassified Candidatus Paralachnospira]|uniref:zinc ribbon domain-containing protein n=1 Tax=unclassified Candidatus Paralachnospira TaxID=3099471 RepID=UPI003F9118C7